MKDIVIRSWWIKREILLALSCFLLSFLTNIVAVIVYAKPWTEFFTQIGYVCLIAIVFYLIVLVFRLIVLLIKKIFKRI